jgi:uncharacterized protein (TIGR03067 family)
MSMTTSMPPATGSSAAIAKGAITMMAWKHAIHIAAMVLGAVVIAGAGGVVIVQARGAGRPHATAATSALAGQQTDRNAIKGTWEFVSASDSGTPTTDEQLAKLQLVVGDDKWEIQKQGKTIKQANCRIDPAHEPKWVDLVDAARPQAPAVPGIYHVQDDTLQIFYNESRTTRPTEFPRAADSPQDIFWSLRRQTPEDLARQFVVAISDGDLEGAKGFYLTRDEFNQAFQSDDPSKTYDELEQAIISWLTNAAPQLQGAQFVQMLNMPASRKPDLLPKGKTLGPMSAKIGLLAYDNVHAVVRVGNSYLDLKLDEIMQINGSLRLLSPGRIRPTTQQAAR